MSVPPPEAQRSAPVPVDVSRGSGVDTTLVLGLATAAAATAALGRTQIVFGLALFLAGVVAVVGVVRLRRRPGLLIAACVVSVLLASIAVWRFTVSASVDAGTRIGPPVRASTLPMPAPNAPSTLPGASLMSDGSSPFDPSSAASAATTTDQYLTDQNLFNPIDTLNYAGEPARVNGEPYPQSLKFYLYFDGEQGQATFVLGRHYQRLKAVAGIEDGSGNTFHARLQILVDNRLVFRRDMGKGVANAVDLDVTGGYAVTFKILYLGPETGTAVFGDAKVTGAI